MNSTDNVRERNSLRHWLMVLFSLLFGFLLVFVLLELVFRILPTSDATKRTDVNKTNPYLRFEPNRTVNFSIGKSFDIVTTKRVNAQGFFDDLDFQTNSPLKKVAVIGDSYVEALQVSNSNAIHGQLRSMLNSKFVVNALGMSGSPLSQYVAYAKMAHDELAPDYYVFVIVGNDFDESLLRYLHNAGYHHYNDKLELIRSDLKTPLNKKIIRMSATARYFAINMSGYRFPNPFQKDESQEVFQDNTLMSVDEERLDWSKKATDAFLRDVANIVGGKPVVLVLDGHREHVYSNTSPDENSYSRQMMSYMKEQASKAGAHVIDMHPLFEADHRAHGKKFEFETDWHWNERAHRLAAQAVKEKILSISANAK